MANDKSFNNYAYLVFKQYSFPLTFRALSECAFKQHVQSIHWGATTILKWQVCNICQTLSERSKKMGDGICDLLLYLMLSPNKINVPYYLLFTIIAYVIFTLDFNNGLNILETILNDNWCIMCVDYFSITLYFCVKSICNNMMTKMDKENDSLDW